MGTGRPTHSRAATWAAALVAIVTAVLLLALASRAFATPSPITTVAPSPITTVAPSQVNTAAATPVTIANEPFTVFQGLTGQTVAATPIVVVQPYAAELTRAQIASLHAQNPRTKVIRYVDSVEAIDTVSDLVDPRPWSLSYARRLNSDAEWTDAWTNHRSWFLRDSSGGYINRPSSNAWEMNPKRAYLMDPASAGWRGQVAGRVSQRLSYGYDGVFLDLCSPTPLGYSAVPAKYAGNYGLWRAGINGLIDYVKSKFPNALVITNTVWQGQAYYANDDPNPIDDNAQDGTEIEGFIYGRGNGPTESEANWLKEVQFVKKLGDEGKIVLAQTQLSTDNAASPKKLLAYSLATFLLGKHGTRGGYFIFRTYKAETGFSGAYVNNMFNLPLGDPIGSYYQRGIAYRRDFTRGKVIVNPNDAGLNYTFIPLPANHYKDQDGRIYDSSHPLTLPAKSGALLIAIFLPSVSAVTPSTGSTLGGDTVVIAGNDLTDASKVTFGGVEATQFRVDSPDQITATIPAHAAGTVQVQVTTPVGASVDTPGDDFTYAEPGIPTIASLSPDTGSVEGGTVVTIEGTDFSGLSGTSAVTFDGIDATSYQVVSSLKIIAVAPAHDAGTVRVQVTAVGGTTADTATDDFTYVAAPQVTRYDQTNAYIVKTGIWSNYAKTAAYNGSYGRSNTSGATATVWFSGTRIDWIAMMGTTTGTADVYLDGVKVTSVDLASTTARYQVTAYSSPTLSPGLHSLKIVNTSTKYVTLDAFDIAGAISPAPTRYEQADARILTTGTWTQFTKSTASGGSYGRSSTPAASATITFSGTRLDWIAMKGTTTGLAYVYLDDAVTPATVDLRASVAVYQVMVWSTGVLADGVHTVRIVRDDADSAAGQFVTLDAVDVWGTLR